ncbi:MAG: N-acetylmuramoyl-L-alanine amidase [Desulfomonile tiedjei]|nr:N-acetylmuramoyl-L-alanine amidase [Desulfomonile tiedjei]
MATRSQLIRVALLAGFLAGMVAATPGYAGKRGAPSFDTIRKAYEKLSHDESATRQQWEKLIHAFLAVHKDGKRSRNGSHSLFLAGRCYLGLYRQSGRIEDLNEAIKHLDKFVRIHRKGPYLILGLQGLKEADLLKRKIDRSRSIMVTRRTDDVRLRSAEQSCSPRVGTLQEEAEVRQAPGSQGGKEKVTTGDSGSPTVKSYELPAKPADSYANAQPEASTAAADAETGLDQESASSGFPPGYNLCGNPFYRKPDLTQPQEPARIISASLSPPIVHDAIPPPSKRAAKRRQWVVAIDPGHGGKDPGAISKDGLLKEKEVTLAIAKQLKESLKKQLPGITVEFTRTDDSFVPVQERTALANSANADLFVSIHCNAAEDTNSKGIETYYLNKACSRMSMAVAARENGIPVNQMTEIDGPILDLTLASKKAESVRLAQRVHTSLIHNLAGLTDLRLDRGLKAAPFYVLFGAKMPAILVECGFINGKDEEKLKNEAYVKAIAIGIADGISQHLQRPPLGPRMTRKTSIR